MHLDTSSTTPRRPHMAMLVANRVIGDSRVEKSAVSAVKAGYDVTVVGIRNRTVPTVGSYRGIPVYRVPVLVTRHTAMLHRQSTRPRRRPDWTSLVDELTGHARQGEDSGADLTGAGRLERWAVEAPVPARVHRRVQRWASRADRLTDRALLMRPGAWREVWPQIVDFEEAFLRALIQLEPDIVHAHDRHPMAAADSYRTLMQERGIHVPWIYDAHEWLPGQQIHGPAQARMAWERSETELARRADAVITVSDELAVRMQRRHGLGELPAVAVNAPLTERTPLDPDVRRPLREECGLDPETPLLVYVGRMTVQRGVLDLIDALPLLPGVHVAFVGNDDPVIRGQMTSRAADLGVSDRLHLHSYVPSASVTWYIESATAGVSPLHDNPAHQLAVPTKLSEYVHAGLPVLVSDLAQQSAFVERHGIGAIYSAGSAPDLARAARELLSDLTGYHEALGHAEFLSGQSWTTSERAMTQTWHRLRPANPKALTATPVPDSDGPVLAIVGSERGVARAWRDRMGEVLEVPTSEGRATRDRLATWTQIDRSAHAVLYSRSADAYGAIEGGQLGEVQSLMARGRPVGVHLGHRAVLSPAVVLEAHPEHAFSQWAQEHRERYGRQIRRSTADLRAMLDLGIPLFTSSTLTAQLLPGAHLLQPAVEVDQEPGPDSETTHTADGSATVVVLDVLRTADEAQALLHLEDELKSRGHRLIRPHRGTSIGPEVIGAADLVIDGLHTLEHAEGARWAWTSGVLVVGGPVADSAAPWTSTHEDRLVDDVLGLLTADATRRQELVHQGHTHVRESSTHDRVVETLREAWSL